MWCNFLEQILIYYCSNSSTIKRNFIFSLNWLVNYVVKKLCRSRVVVKYHVLLEDIDRFTCMQLNMQCFSYVGMFNNPAMQNMMQQMMSNPELMQNMMSSPFMEATLSQMRSNPDLANQLLANNPLFASNPQMAEQMRQNLPDMIQRVRMLQHYNSMIWSFVSMWSWVDGLILRLMSAVLWISKAMASYKDWEEQQYWLIFCPILLIVLNLKLWPCLLIPVIASDFIEVKHSCMLYWHSMCLLLKK